METLEVNFRIQILIQITIWYHIGYPISKSVNRRCQEYRAGDISKPVIHGRFFSFTLWIVSGVRYCTPVHWKLAFYKEPETHGLVNLVTLEISGDISKPTINIKLIQILQLDFLFNLEIFYPRKWAKFFYFKAIGLWIIIIYNYFAGKFLISRKSCCTQFYRL